MRTTRLRPRTTSRKPTRKPTRKRTTTRLRRWQHLLHRRAIGPFGTDHVDQRGIEVRQPPRQRGGRIGADLSVGDMAQPVALGADHAPAGGAKPGIEAENDHDDSTRRCGGVGKKACSRSGAETQRASVRSASRASAHRLRPVLPVKKPRRGMNDLSAPPRLRANKPRDLPACRDAAWGLPPQPLPRRGGAFVASPQLCHHPNFSMTASDTS